MQARIPSSIGAYQNRSASWLRSLSSHSKSRRTAQHGPCTNVIADQSCGRKQVQRTAPFIAGSLKLGVNVAPGLANQASTAPFFDAQTGRCVVCPQVGRFENNSPPLAVAGGQTGHQLGVDNLVALALPTSVSRSLLAMPLFRDCLSHQFKAGEPQI